MALRDDTPSDRWETRSKHLALYDLHEFRV